MRARQEPVEHRLELRAFYTMTALARLANVSRDVLRRVLRANHVRFVRSGRVLFVPLSEIERKIPPLWESLCAAEKARRLAAETHTR